MVKPAFGFTPDFHGGSSSIFDI